MSVTWNKFYLRVFGLNKFSFRSFSFIRVKFLDHSPECDRIGIALGMLERTCFQTVRYDSVLQDY